jgi:hypothetical protein
MNDDTYDLTTSIILTLVMKKLLINEEKVNKTLIGCEKNTSFVIPPIIPLS